MDEEFIRDFFASEGPVAIRRMFGGRGIYLDGIIVAIVLQDELLLKADDESATLFEAAGAERWRYQREGGAPVAMPYYTVPSGALDDPDEMALWARRARDAGLRARKPAKAARKPRS